LPYVSTLTADVTDKKPGELVYSADWNALASAVVHLSENKLDRADNALQGDLNVPGSLAVDGATTLQQGVTVAGLAQLQQGLSVDGSSKIGGSLQVQRELAAGEAVRAPVFISTSRMIHRMYPASPLIYEDIFVALDRGVIAKLGNPRLEEDWNVRHTAAKPYRGRPLLQLGSSNDSDGNGAVVTVPEGYNTLWLRVHGGGGSAGLKAYFLDGAGEALGRWSGAQRPYQVCPDGSLPDNAGAKEGYDHQWLAIPVGRSGKVALISQQSDGYVWYSGVAFSRNPWAHAAQSARGYALGFNSSRGVTWHSAQSFGDQAGSIAPSQAGSYLFSAQWGVCGSGNGQFNQPHGVAVDSRGNVYVADRDNHRIQKFDSSGGFLTKWGGYGSGNGQFNRPAYVAVDSSGNVYVTDAENHRVQKFDSNGGYLTQWGGYGGGNGQFLNPYGVAVDSSGNVYVADWGNHRVQKFDSNGRHLAQLGSRGSGSGQFLNPYGVAVDSSGNVYVVEYDNQRLQKLDSNGRFLTKWGGYGSGNGQFFNPTGVAVDSSGNVYVAELQNHRVQKFDSIGGYLTQWGGYGGGNGQFNVPTGMAVDSSGNVYVADRDNHRVQKFAQGNLLQVPVIPNGRDKLLYLVNAPQLKDEASYDNGLQFTALRVNGQPVERFMTTYTNPFARYWNSRPGCNYNAAWVPAERIPADARFLSVEIDLSRQFDDIKFREVGTHDLDVPLAE
jgi:DNA-binding beta-propeller fold protein YncE